jgi:hypothetical protein
MNKITNKVTLRVAFLLWGTVILAALCVQKRIMEGIDNIFSSSL